MTEPTPSPMSGNTVFCADVGGSFVRFARSREAGRVEVLESVSTPATSFDALAETFGALLHRHGAGPRDPFALSIAGLVDVDPGGPGALAANIPGVNGHDIGRELTDRLGRPVRAANDADCFALAEAVDGEGSGHRVVFALVLGTGVGGGLVVDGRLVQGAAGISGEWGHGPVLKTEAHLPGGETVRIARLRCGCGQDGCVDTVGGARGLERLHAALGNGVADSRAIVAGFERGEAGATRTLHAYADLVADPLSVVANLTGASLLPVGGGLGSAALLVDLLDRTVRARILRDPGRPLVVPARFGAQGGLAGAALLARSAPG